MYGLRPFFEWIATQQVPDQVHEQRSLSFLMHTAILVARLNPARQGASNAVVPQCSANAGFARHKGRMFVGLAFWSL